MGAHYERAQVLIRQKRYVEAERELREELAENPHGGLTHAFLGHCLAQQKRMTEAVEAGEEGVRLAPQAGACALSAGADVMWTAVAMRRRRRRCGRRCG